jgi:hypothetical protein
MKNNRVNHCLVFGVILLFIGLSIAPSINFNVAKASNDSDSVEVTTQACGIQGFGNTTVKLTGQQYQNLEQYLVDFRARLNQTTTREEAVPIFKEAVRELNKFGLLPKGMSVEKAQKLVTKRYEYRRGTTFLEKLRSTNQYMVNSNVLCFIAGQSTRTYFISLISRIALIPYGASYPSLPGISLLFEIIFALSVLVGNFIPLAFLNWILFGDMHSRPSFHIEPANGWIYTVGLTCVKTWTGYFSGGIFITLGAIDFTGLKLLVQGESTFLGTAFWVRIEP